MVTPPSSGVAALLVRLERFGRAQALELVQPPRTADDVSRTLASAGVPAQEALLAWFGAWDGQGNGGVLGDIDVLPGYYALSLAEALDHKAHQAAWPREWLPLLSDGGGDFYIADCAAVGVRVLTYRSDELAAQVASTSLNEFLTTAVEAFDSGVVFLKDGYLEMDDEEWLRLTTVSV